MKEAEITCADSGGSTEQAESVQSRDDMRVRFARYREKIEKLRPIDDYFFEKLAEDKGVCEEILRVILEDPQLEVLSVTPQNSIRNLQGRSVRLDALCRTSRRGMCNVEVQKADDDDHFRRARYHASCITANITDPGAGFRDVPNVCIIYITKFDIIGRGKTVYHVRMRDDETGTAVEDGLECIYANTRIDDGSETAELMQCFMQEKVRNAKFPNLSRRVAYFKEDEKGVREMSSVMEKIRQEGRKEGRQEGRREGIIATVETAVEFGALIDQAIEKTAQKFHVTREYVENLYNARR